VTRYFPTLKADWQSKAVLLLVLPFTAAGLVLEAGEWFANRPPVAEWALGLSLLLGLMAWKLRAATAGAAMTGSLLTANLMLSTVVYPYRPWETALMPVLAVMVLTSLATRFGRRHKERIGVAERPRGRGAVQVAANIGMAALVLEPAMLSWLQSGLEGLHGLSGKAISVPLFAVGLAALAEAAADTVSSEIGQVVGGQPRLLTTLRKVEPGTDGGITLAGTLAGILAAAVVAVVGSEALRGGGLMLGAAAAGGVFGLFFDSLLGATLERRGWLNNDAVNFLSTASAAAFAWGLLLLLP
jgi:uncharacterized protein (TIGR00297 family)